MLYWELFAIAGLGFLILEIIVPTAFFLNLAISGFLTAIFSLIYPSLTVLILLFVAFSLLSILLIRPLILKRKSNDESDKTGIEGKYIGKVARVIEPISKFKGAITIYDERWEARYDGEGEIPIGEEIRILKNDSLVMYVEKL